MKIRILLQKDIHPKIPRLRVYGSFQAYIGIKFSLTSMSSSTILVMGRLCFLTTRFFTPCMKTVPRVDKVLKVVAPPPLPAQSVVGSVVIWLKDYHRFKYWRGTKSQPIACHIKNNHIKRFYLTTYLLLFLCGRKLVVTQRPSNI